MDDGSGGYSVGVTCGGGMEMTSQQNASEEDVVWFAGLFERLTANVELFIRGKSELVRTAAVCMIANGHLLIEDPPGTGKTSLAKALVASVDGIYRRIQFTPDLLPSDVTGMSIYRSNTGEFEFKPGPIFANMVLADEINRASPKTQSALLEVMEERTVTVEGFSREVPRPFVVIATQNPIEHGGTYRLPEAQLDRFMMKLSVGYPAPESEVEVLVNHRLGKLPERLRPVATKADITRMTEIAAAVYLSDDVVDYIVTLTRATRKMPESLSLGASPRGAIALQAAAQARAASQGRNFVKPADVKALASVVLAHRLILQPDAEIRGVSATDLIENLLTDVRVPVPAQRPGR